ncbi:MAG: hypothetical protein M0P09_01155 [Acholeplasmataceae bacterium]|nr:hypothetical protein [Acholeplasmataceae bacterium]
MLVKGLHFTVLKYLTLIVLAFIFGFVAMDKALTRDVIQLDKNGESLELEVHLGEVTNKSLVPQGKVKNETEIDVIVLKYQITIKNNRTEKTLKNEVTAVVDEEGNAMTPFLVILKPSDTMITKSKVLTFEVRLASPLTREEYEMIAQKHLIMKLQFWVE